MPAVSPEEESVIIEETVVEEPAVAEEPEEETIKLPKGAFSAIEEAEKIEMAHSKGWDEPIVSVSIVSFPLLLGIGIIIGAITAVIVISAIKSKKKIGD